MNLKLYYDFYYLHDNPAEIRLVVKQVKFPYRKIKIKVADLFFIKPQSKKIILNNLISGGEDKMIEILTEEIKRKSNKSNVEENIKDLKKELLEMKTNYFISEELWKVLKKKALEWVY